MGEQVVLDLASLNRSQLQEANSSMESWLSSPNETNESSVQLAAAWGIPNHPIRRAMVCHAVFGPGHRFLRRACWLTGFVQRSAGMGNSNASLDISELDEVDKSLGYSVSNASNASEDELTSQWGIPSHPIARAMFAMRFLVQLTGSFAELVGGLGVKRLELLCACLLFIHHSFLRSYYMLHCHPFARVLDVFTTLYRLQGSFSQEL